MVSFVLEMVYLNAHYIVCLGIFGLTRSVLAFCNSWTLKLETKRIGTIIPILVINGLRRGPGNSNNAQLSLDTWDCPVCLERIGRGREIFSCHNGHMVCPDCDGQLSQNHALDCRYFRTLDRCAHSALKIGLRGTFCARPMLLNMVVLAL